MGSFILCFPLRWFAGDAASHWKPIQCRVSVTGSSGGAAAGTAGASSHVITFATLDWLEWLVASAAVYCQVKQGLEVIRGKRGLNVREGKKQVRGRGIALEEGLLCDEKWGKLGKAKGTTFRNDRERNR